MTPEEKDVRAVHAKELLENPLLKKSLLYIREVILREWETTPSNDVEHREHLWRMYNNANSFENVLRGFIQTGEIARKQLRDSETFKQRVKRVL